MVTAPGRREPSPQTLDGGGVVVVSQASLAPPGEQQGQPYLHEGPLPLATRTAAPRPHQPLLQSPPIHSPPPSVPPSHPTPD